MYWWEKPRTNQELWGFDADELLAHRIEVLERIDYWASGRLPRSPFWASREDAKLFLTSLRHELYELNRELSRRGYCAVRVGEELSH